MLAISRDQTDLRGVDRLIIENVRLSKKAEQNLFRAMEGNATLREVSISSIRVADPVAFAGRLAAVLHSLPALHTVQFDMPAVQTFAEALGTVHFKRLKLLSREGERFTMRALAEFLEKNTTVSVLELCMVHFVGPTQLSTFGGVTQLNLSGSLFADGTFRYFVLAFEKSRSLKTLDFFSCRLDKEDMLSAIEAAQKIPTLERLNFQMNPSGPATVHAFIHALESVSRADLVLRLPMENITADLLLALAKTVRGNPFLESLMITTA